MGQIPRRADIVDISTGTPCEITTDGDHGFLTHEFVRFTGLNGARMVTPVQAHGEDQLNNNRYRLIVTDTDKFIIQDPITFLPIDSSTFPPYIEGGSANIISQDFFYYPDAEE